MGVCLFANDAVASLAAAVATTDTAIPLATGSGDLFPNPTGGDYFQAVLYSASEQEIVKVTARAGDTLTVLRAQENTAAQNFAAGDKIELRLTAAVMQAMAQGTGLGTSASRNVGQVAGDVPDGAFSVRTGCILPFAGAAIPSDYILCNGQAISRTTYAALFAVIGTLYGAGDGVNTFNVPNLSGAVPLGVSGTHALASAGGSETQTVTVQGHALTIAEQPAHSHTWADTPHGHGVLDPGHTHQLNDGGHTHGVADPGHAHGYTAMQAPWNGANNDLNAGTNGSQYNEETTLNATGIGIYASNANVSINGAYANVSLQTANINGVIGTTGGGQAHTHGATSTTNLPPFVALNFIIKD